MLRPDDFAFLTLENQLFADKAIIISYNYFGLLRYELKWGDGFQVSSFIGSCWYVQFKIRI
jgi:hypothetical protein